MHYYYYYYYYYYHHHHHHHPASQAHTTLSLRWPSDTLSSDTCECAPRFGGSEWRREGGRVRARRCRREEEWRGDEGEGARGQGTLAWCMHC